MRSEGVGDHVCPLGVGASIVLRSRLAFRVRLHHESAEVGNLTIDFGNLVLPPLLDFSIERVRGLQLAQFHWRRKTSGEIDLDAVWTQGIRNRLGLLDVVRSKHHRIGVDVRQNRPVDPNRGICTGVVDDPGVNVVRQLVPIPNRLSSITSLN